MQKTDEHQFLYETSTALTVPQITKELVELQNLRTRIHRLKLEGEELAKYGPAKLPDKQGIDEYAEQPVEKGEYYKMDPTGRRTGNGTAQRYVDRKLPVLAPATRRTCCTQLVSPE